MKRVKVTPEAACTWLKDQLEALDQFRNASTRDASFRQWRQSTLTVIQRIWPGVTARSSRFRRIPFSPPSTLADARQSREAFERGCSEATLLVRAWVAEIEAKGILLENSEPSVSEEVAYGAPVLSLDQETPRGDSDQGLLDPGVPTLDLPSSDAASDANAPPKTSKSSKGSGAKAPKAARARTSSAKPGRLKDMLGLAHLSAAAGAPDESERFRAAMEEAKAVLADTSAVAPAAAAPAETRPDPFDLTVRTDPEPTVIVEVVPPATHPAFSMSVPFTLTPAPTSMERLDVSDLELTFVDDPILTLSAGARAHELEGAAEMTRIAGDIAAYDVPAAEFDRVRRTLLDLAHAIERGDPSWDALRAATAVVMHYPKLGRRAMPLLLPLLDRTG